MMVIDAIWLGLIATKFYLPKMDKVARQNTGQPFSPKWFTTFLVYVILTLGIMLFVLPRVSGSSYLVAWVDGAFFGLIVYGVYVLTNFSTLKGVSLNLVVVDIAWGIVLCGVASMAAVWFNQIFV